MKNTIIITEGKFDSMVLEKILKSSDLSNKYSIEPALGYSSALSKAKSYISMNKRVLLVVESDSNINSEVDDRKYFIENYIRPNDTKNFKAVIFEPEFEVIFLENKSFLKKHFHDLVEDFRLQKIFKLSPKKMIETELGIKREKLLQFIDDVEIINDFKSEKKISEIIDYINGI